MIDPKAIERAREAADMLRAYSPDIASKIDQAIDDYTAGKRDGLKIDVAINYKLEKFDGEYSPDKEPVEVITGVG